MDLSNSTVKTPEAESETPTRIQPVKPLPFTNGVLKRHPPLNHHPVVVTYKECLKNHAAALGGHAVDGCGEFMPSPASNPANPTSLKCAACGCHRNFHRREPDEFPTGASVPAPALEYQPLHRHHPPPPPAPQPQPRSNSGSSPNNSPSPPPISSAYYPSAPHMLLALSHGSAPPGSDPNNNINISNNNNNNNSHPISPAPINTNATPIIFSSSSSSRKRFRTKFTQNQKDKMLEFAEKLGWKMQKRDEDSIQEFCAETGVDKGVFKVWMHNNKNTSAKTKDQHLPHLDHNIAISTPPPGTGSNGLNYGSIGFDQGNNNDTKQNVQDLGHHHVVGTNGSSSSS